MEEPMNPRNEVPEPLVLAAIERAVRHRERDTVPAWEMYTPTWAFLTAPAAHAPLAASSKRSPRLGRLSPPADMAWKCGR